MRSPQPALEYLLTCSQSSLEGFELARLDQISGLRRKIGEIQNEWIEAEVAARLARLLLEGRRGENQNRSAPESLLSGLPALSSGSVEASLEAGGIAGMLEAFAPSLFAHLESCQPSPAAAAGKIPGALFADEVGKSLPPRSMPPKDAANPDPATERVSPDKSTNEPLTGAMFPNVPAREIAARPCALQRSRPFASIRFPRVSSDLPAPSRRVPQEPQHKIRQLGLFDDRFGSHAAPLQLGSSQTSESTVALPLPSPGANEIYGATSPFPAQPKSTRKEQRAPCQVSQVPHSGSACKVPQVSRSGSACQVSQVPCSGSACQVSQVPRSGSAFQVSQVHRSGSACQVSQVPRSGSPLGLSFIRKAVRTHHPAIWPSLARDLSTVDCQAPATRASEN